ncbi:MAG: HAD family hydrolase [Chloroflexi bacterium]|nr:HAD family hydrolase [Chloroflexota bacterium]MCI0578177.1 HAD family hydrolase [Chloroflexota bacterium]MCI0649158.1 HAD family hydrolase [Chloroflexota bacterium]MCI0725351.1 HAD family hydrolase [Chloroflexota bacterium]
MDGTLINTDDTAVERLAGRLRPLFRKRSVPAARWLLMRAETPGNVFISGLDALGLDARLVHVTDRLRRRRGMYPAPEFQLIPGVEEMLLALQERYKLGIVTTRSRYHIDKFLERFPSLAVAFQASCGLQDTFRLKPHPAPVLLAAERLKVPVGHCLMVGDTTVDVKAARRAGAWAAAVLCGFGERRELEQAGAHVILDSTADLVKLL